MKKIRIARNIQCRMWVTYLLLPLLLASCEASDKEMIPAVTEGDFVFCLSLPPALTVNTRAGAIGGISVDDVWVIQFNENDEMIATKHYDSSAISQLEDESGNENSVLLQVKTDGFSDVNSTFRVIGNFGSDALTTFSSSTNATKKDLQAFTISFTSYDKQRNLLVSNDIKYEKKTTENSSVAAVITAPLNYAYAWIDVKWTNKVISPAKFVLNSIKAYGLPQTLAIDSRSGAESGVYPEKAEGTYEVAVAKENNPLTDGSTPYPFYMPENLRGIGCGTSFQEKNLTSYGPTSTGTAPALGTDGKPEAGGSLDNCTYIDLEGFYYYAIGTGAAVAPVTARYRLYLGGNLMNDYNIRRGYHYTITVEISGINSADVRVTITDGAVVVFDNVDTINMTVDF